MREMSQTLLPAKFRPPPLAAPDPQDLLAWKQRYERALLRLEAEGIKVPRDRQGGAEQYVTLRRQWDPYVKALARFVLREWSEVAPHEQPPASASPRS